MIGSAVKGGTYFHYDGASPDVIAETDGSGHGALFATGAPGVLKQKNEDLDNAKNSGSSDADVERELKNNEAHKRCASQFATGTAQGVGGYTATWEASRFS